jgi:3-oxoacyl-[acyl-carrier-protein] synthase-1
MIRGFDPQAYLSRKERKTMTDFGLQAYVSAMEAVGMSGLDPADLRNPRTGLIYGCDSSCQAADEQTGLTRQAQSTRSITSGCIFRAMTSNVTMNLNTLLGTQGACWTLSSACSSGGHAVGQAADLIACGRQDRVLCGGAQEINWESMCSFDALEAFSTRVDAPAEASRPFDADRDGLVPSGGAASVLLERYDLARARGATILGEVRGYGFSSDGERLSVPSVGGLQRAMEMALDQANWSTGQIDFICAHATSTVPGDASEAANIRRVFPDCRPWVSALKAMTGHELWMSGASQVVYCTIMAQQGFVARSLNLHRLDPACEGLRIAVDRIEAPPARMLANAAGFGGTNSCLALDFTRGNQPRSSI